MSRLLIQNIHTLVTMGEVERITHDVDILVENDRITAIGRGLGEGRAPARP